MITIVAGTRTITDESIVAQCLDEFEAQSSRLISEVVSGGAKGVDAAGEAWASENNVPVSRFPADWDAHGKAAGPIRNREMAEYAGALIAVWDGKSRGTRNMIDEAKKRGLLIYTFAVRDGRVAACEVWRKVQSSLFAGDDQ